MSSNQIQMQIDLYNDQNLAIDDQNLANDQTNVITTALIKDSVSSVMKNLTLTSHCRQLHQQTNALKFLNEELYNDKYHLTMGYQDLQREINRLKIDNDRLRFENDQLKSELNQSQKNYY